MRRPKRDAVESIGERFGFLVVNKIQRIDGETLATCDCDCGTKEKVVAISSLRSGSTKSCGCYSREVTRMKGIANLKHGHCRRVEPKSKAYKLWASMIRRCHTPSASGYFKYGAKGVTVCDAWRNSFECFLADMGDPPPNMTIDRIDNSKGYSKENCRWVGNLAQARNKTSNLKVEIYGQVKCLSEWVEHFGANYQRAYARHQLGWTPEEIFDLT